MGTFAVGDVHGHARTLRALLDEAGFREGKDRLWFVGDLVNRGPDSLAVLRFVAGLGDRAVVVLGNHDLHLIGRALGVREARRDDTFDGVLEAHDGEALVSWLRARPFVHREDDWLMVHAGLLPSWSPGLAVEAAEDAAHGMQTEDAARLVARRDESRDVSWQPDLEPAVRRRLAVDAMTRMRVVRPDGSMELEFSGPPQEAPPGTVPWFEAPGRASTAVDVVFGHWAALGSIVREGIYGLDSGCVWGGPLTCLRLDDRKPFQVENVES